MKPVKYEVFEDDEYIGDFTAEELRKKIGITAKTLYGYVNKDMKYKKHYIFERSCQVTRLTVNDKLMKEWDRVRLLLNPKAKRGHEGE